MEVDRAKIPEGVRTVCRELQHAGYQAWIVGGCVRDLLLGREVADWDVCTTALPEQVKKTFRKVIPTGIQHGTVTVMLGGEGFEVTTLRGETTYTDGRHPDSVFFVEDLKEDLARRDFTINAIAYDVNLEQVVDPFDGVGAINAKCITAVGDANERFAEDGLRVLRGARFCATLEFALDESTRSAIAANLPTFRRVSVERIREEWLKTMKAKEPSRAFRVMLESGILSAVSAELASAIQAQGSEPRALKVMDQLAKGDPCFRLLGLFTALTSTQVDGLMKHLKFSNDERKRASLVMQAIANAPLANVAHAPTMRRWLRTFSLETLGDWATLSRVMALVDDDSAKLAQVEECESRAKLILARGDALHLGDLAIDGSTLQKELQIPPSKLLGVLLNHLLERVLDEPLENERERLLAIARAHPRN